MYIIANSSSICRVVVRAHDCETLSLAESGIKTSSRDSAVMNRNFCRRVFTNATKRVCADDVEISQDHCSKVLICTDKILNHLLRSELGGPVRAHGTLWGVLSNRHLIRITVGRACTTVHKAVDFASSHPLKDMLSVGGHVFVVQQGILVEMRELLETQHTTRTGCASHSVRLCNICQCSEMNHHIKL